MKEEVEEEEHFIFLVVLYYFNICYNIQYYIPPIGISSKLLCFFFFFLLIISSTIFSVRCRTALLVPSSIAFPALLATCFIVIPATPFDAAPTILRAIVDQIPLPCT